MYKICNKSELSHFDKTTKIEKFGGENWKRIELCTIRKNYAEFKTHSLSLPNSREQYKLQVFPKAFV